MNEAQFKHECFLLHNDYRKKKGAKPLKWSDSLARAAEHHAEQMAAGKHSFSHGNWVKRIARFVGRRAASGAQLAENIAYGQDTAAEVVKQWIASPSHERNMKDKKLRKAGIGFAKRGSREYWVVDFGTF